MKKLIPVIAFQSINETEPVLTALLRGGVDYAEITFRTDCAAEAIVVARKKFPEMTVGAGTVINAVQCQAAIEAGAQFIVSPGLSEEVALLCKKNEIPYYPGCVTPTEIMKAISLGLDVVKFFPTNVYGGLKAIKALSAPFPKLRFIPTGGVDLENLSEFIASEKVFAVGGSFMLKSNIEEVCKKAMQIVKEAERQ